MPSPLWQKVIRFAAVGGTATAVHAVVALMLHYQFGIGALTANAAAFVTAWGVSYIANWAWTFEAASPHQTSAPRFFAISVSGFALNQALLWLTFTVLGWPMWLALIPSVIAVPAASFAASYLWAFAVPAETNPASS